MKTEDQRIANAAETVAASDVAAATRPNLSPLERIRGSLAYLRVSEAMRHLARDRSVRVALFTFNLSRAIVLAIFEVIGLMKTAPDEFPGHSTLIIRSTRHRFRVCFVGKF
jgi:hypothetical protein